MASLLSFPSAAWGSGVSVPEGTCDWSAGFGGQGADDDVDALLVWDDGGGDALYAAGEFTAFGSKSLGYIAKWNGSTWSSLAGGMDREVRALAIWDDGSGEALYAGGNFTQAGGVAANYIAKWDGSAWTSVGGGTSTSVYALTVWDDGGGDALYAAGRFGMAGGVAATRIAKWDGTTWSALGSGLGQTVETLAVFDDGTGSALYAGGWFTSAGGQPANRVAKWDGAAWSALGTGVDSTVFTLLAWDDGGGEDLYLGGFFDSADGDGDIDRIARWDGSAFSNLSAGEGINGTVRDLTLWDDGNGESLYAAGDFTFADGVLSLRAARFDGVSWHPLSHLGPSTFGAHAIAPYDDGNGPLLFLGGGFTSFSGLGMRYLATWDGTDWAPVLDDDGGDGLNASPLAFAVFDDGAGPALYVGGDFTAAGSAAARHVGRWDGTSWSSLGDGRFNEVTALAVYNDGSGPALYATDGNLVKWDGTEWSLVQTFIGPAYDLAVHDDGSGAALYVAGRLADFSDDLEDLYVGRWDGAAWSFLFYAFEDGGGEPEDDIFALASFDRGGGAELFAGGRLPSRGELMKHDGVSWSDFDTGLEGAENQGVDALQESSVSGASKLYAGGNFTIAEGASADYIAFLDGALWVPLASGVDGPVASLGLFDEGSGAALYVGGDFTQAGGGATNRIARWDGTNWSPLGSGLDDTASILASYDAGTGAELYVGGPFLDAGGEASARFARWSCPGAPGPDLGVTVDGPDGDLLPGFTVSYDVTVSNARAVDVPRSSVAVTIPAEFACSWTSRSVGGASGYSQGTTGQPLDTLVMPAGASVDYVFECFIDPAAGGEISFRATLAAPLDSEPSNNEETSSATAIPILFADDFEGGDTSRWGS